MKTKILCFEYEVGSGINGEGFQFSLEKEGKLMGVYSDYLLEPLAHEGALQMIKMLLQDAIQEADDLLEDCTSKGAIVSYFTDTR